MQAVRNNGLALQHASISLRGEVHIISQAVLQNPDARKYSLLFSLSNNELSHLPCINGNVCDELYNHKEAVSKFVSENSMTCNICFEDFENKFDKIYQTSCQHNYHRDCLKDWAKKGNDCPYCRQYPFIINDQLIDIELQ
jgi:hypothetical protein